MPGSFSSLHYHITFGTKDRRPLITPDVRDSLYAYLAGIIRNQGGTATVIGGTSDHVHILAELDRHRALAEVVRDIKAGSSRWVHVTYPERGDFAWQQGYGAFTVSVRGIPQVKAYIARQAEHHRKVSFREEFALFLRQHDIAYDERYL